jgi:putative phosphoribosyl transferase
MNPSDRRVQSVQHRLRTIEAVQFGTTTSAELSVPDRSTGTVILLGPTAIADSDEAPSLAGFLNDQGLATLSIVLETRNAHALNTAALPALARRLADIADWVRSEPHVAGHPCGCLAAGFEAAVALAAASMRPRCLDALVLLNGRTDLVEQHVALVEVPTLLIEEGTDKIGLTRARKMLDTLPGDADLTLVAGLGETVVAEPGCCDVSDVAGRWFRQHFAAAVDSPVSRIDQRAAV